MNIDFHTFFSIAYSKNYNSSRMLNYWNNSRYGNYYEWWAERNDTNDKNGDGIVDYPWVIDENNTDYRPLKNPVVWNVGTNRESGKGEWKFYIIPAAIVLFSVFLLALWKRRNV